VLVCCLTEELTIQLARWPRVVMVCARHDTRLSIGSSLQSRANAIRCKPPQNARNLIVSGCRRAQRIGVAVRDMFIEVHQQEE
jgi:hypothetical protein